MACAPPIRIDFVYAGKTGGGEHERMMPPRRRHHHDDTRDTRDLGRHRVHQDRRGIGRRAAGNIEADRLDRGEPPAEFDAERIGEALVLRHLAAVIGLDAVAGEFERVERLALQAAARLRFRRR